jgi:hypothetical protein
MEFWLLGGDADSFSGRRYVGPYNRRRGVDREKAPTCRRRLNVPRRRLNVPSAAKRLTSAAKLARSVPRAEGWVIMVVSKTRCQMISYVYTLFHARADHCRPAGARFTSVLLF